MIVRPTTRTSIVGGEEASCVAVSTQSKPNLSETAWAVPVSLYGTPSKVDSLIHVAATIINADPVSVRSRCLCHGPEDIEGVTAINCFASMRASRPSQTAIRLLPRANEPINSGHGGTRHTHLLHLACVIAVGAINHRGTGLPDLTLA